MPQSLGDMPMVLHVNCRDPQEPPRARAPPDKCPRRGRTCGDPGSSRPASSKRTAGGCREGLTPGRSTPKAGCCRAKEGHRQRAFRLNFNWRALFAYSLLAGFAAAQGRAERPRHATEEEPRAAAVLAQSAARGRGGPHNTFSSSPSPPQRRCALDPRTPLRSLRQAGHVPRGHRKGTPQHSQRRAGSSLRRGGGSWRARAMASASASAFLSLSRVSSPVTGISP